MAGREFRRLDRRPVLVGYRIGWQDRVFAALFALLLFAAGAGIFAAALAYGWPLWAQLVTGGVGLFAFLSGAMAAEMAWSGR
jgi:hypothetical protein